MRNKNKLWFQIQKKRRYQNIVYLLSEIYHLQYCERFRIVYKKALEIKV